LVAVVVVLAVSLVIARRPDGDATHLVGPGGVGRCVSTVSCPP